MTTARAVSRRGFLQCGGAVTGGAVRTPAADSVHAASIPRRAWTIVGINWEYNDEFCYEAGEFLEPKVYFDEAEAHAGCRKLCDEFFAQSPQEFEPCWQAYDVDCETATWDELRQAGFPDPFSVKELER